MQELDFLESLFDKKLVSVMRVFFRFPEKKFYLKEVSDNSRVSQATTHRILSRIVRLGILDEIKISKFKVYQLAKNDKVGFLGTFMQETVKIAEIFVEMVKSLDGVEKIIQVGKESNNKTNMLVIGEGVDQGKLKIAAGNIKEKYGAKVTHISMAEEQYKQMSEMGLYPGVKKVLYSI